MKKKGEGVKKKGVWGGSHRRPLYTQLTVGPANPGRLLTHSSPFLGESVGAIIGALPLCFGVRDDAFPAVFSTANCHNRRMSDSRRWEERRVCQEI